MNTDNNQNANEDSVKLLAYTPKGKDQSGQNGNAQTGAYRNDPKFSDRQVWANIVRKTDKEGI